jgi:hypothetical protein
MTSHVAVIADLHNELVNRTCAPNPELIARVSQVLLDDTFKKTWLTIIARRRPLAAALLWSRIADQLSGPARLEALALAATCAFHGGSTAIAANLITAADVTARRYTNIAYPPMLTALKFERQIRTYLGLSDR